MTIEHETNYLGGDHPDGVRRGVADSIRISFEYLKPLTPPSQELVTSVEIDSETIEFSQDELQSVIPSEIPGMYEVNLLGGSTKKRKIAGAISGLVLGVVILAGAKHISQRRKN